MNKAVGGGNSLVSSNSLRNEKPINSPLLNTISAINQGIMHVDKIRHYMVSTTVYDQQAFLSATDISAARYCSRLLGL